MICPICQQAFHRDDSVALPFCSPRCQRIDLGRWLGESYSLPEDPEEDEEDEEERRSEEG